MKLPYPCHRFSRREMLRRCALGFGGVALTALQHAAASPTPPHFPARARNVIFLYMDGGPSQVDTFDYKPALEKYHGQDPRTVIGALAPTQFDNVGKILKHQWEFKQHGESAHWISSLFPYLATVADDLAIVKSMTSNFPEHTSANYFLHTGSGLQGRPSMGAWTGYGLGSENNNLPGFVVLNGGLIPPGGLDCFGSGFLPATYQGSIFLPKEQPIANIHPSEPSANLQRNKLDVLHDLDLATLDASGHDGQIDAAIQNYETAFRMQAAVPELMDLRGESDAVKSLYGMDSSYANTRTFGLECLLARRLVERGVRFIELTCPNGNGDRWDQHSRLVDGHTKNCLTVDQPIAGLLTDLKRLGLLETTLVVWAGEFGRTPFAQGSDGRDHNQFGFTIWMAGGGVKAGASIGRTDDFGYKTVEDRFEIHDLHATMLYLLGIEHTKSTFRFSGRDMRLTDVHGHVMHQVIA
jgi:hypothetical protein